MVCLLLIFLLDISEVSKTIKDVEINGLYKYISTYEIIKEAVQSEPNDRIIGLISNSAIGNINLYSDLNAEELIPELEKIRDFATDSRLKWWISSRIKLLKRSKQAKNL